MTGVDPNTPPLGPPTTQVCAWSDRERPQSTLYSEGACHRTQEVPGQHRRVWPRTLWRREQRMPCLTWPNPEGLAETFRPKLAHPSALHAAIRLRHAAPAPL